MRYCPGRLNFVLNFSNDFRLFQQKRKFTMKQSSDWRAPMELFEQIDKDAARFVFESAEKRLKNILETSDKTTTRAYSILTATIPLLAILFTALFKHHFGDAQSHLSGLLLTVSWITVIVCLVSSAMMLRVAFPRDMQQIGREPKLLFTPEMLTHDYYQHEKQLKLFLIYEMQDIQQRICFMQGQSNIRVGLFKKAIYLLFGYALLCFSILVVLALFQ